MSATRSSPFAVEVACRVCGGRHRVCGDAEVVRQPIVFGGAGRTTGPVETGLPWAGMLTCPVGEEPWEAELLIPARDGEAIGRVNVSIVELVASAASSSPANGSGEVDRLSAPAGGAGEQSWVDEELKEWRKASVTTARTYATTMLTTSSGGVPLYFAVLTYLGWTKANFSTPWVVASVIPPVLLFAAAGAFTLALRPSLSHVDRADYAAFRARRIRQMQSRSTVGTLLFLAALLVAIVVFVALLARRLP